MTPQARALFEQITDLPEYYPTRTELRILQDNAAAIAAYIPPGSALVEFGSGSSRKTRILLAAAPQLAAYVPVDISGEMLEQEAIELRKEFPNLKVHAGGCGFHPSVRAARFNSRDARRFFPGLDHRQFRAA